ncbi:hypothetical protein LCGC14_2986550 [marine sediment metagenome]|uniref:Uncharacterized protein n=1 Tax=marine sediment metagenome TaxID=412755 RepID=A0A0F8X5Y9_9ZZZZ
MNETTVYGCSLGSVIAVVLSYSINKSILWAILHGVFGWFYVIYFATKY